MENEEEKMSNWNKFFSWKMVLRFWLSGPLIAMAITSIYWLFLFLITFGFGIIYSAAAYKDSTYREAVLDITLNILFMGTITTIVILPLFTMITLINETMKGRKKDENSMSVG